MYGKGILKGLSVTWKRFWDTYTEDISWMLRGKKRYNTEEGIRHRSSKDTKGIFTVQYPEEQLIVPEEFRYVPFLVYDEGADGKKEIRCTSCGICSKVCPPQCIWIVRTNDPSTGRPVPVPTNFYVDMDICMNCGFCAEYCPFDAIKMDHDFDIASYDRNVYNLDKLLKPAKYYAEIRPENYTREEEARKAKEAAKAAKAEAAAA
ncbi:MAG: 4Fe-4S binding protein [Anaerolineales bacterium]|uniref:4Fe-4S binding protein n=1 Tax=Candidatus Villigracilis affinis TaxID=3140682 RepID=UPI001E1A5B05|nr:4Fe-4S binding protein [Anaerolineales bacterium]MBK9601363.1 4Fe-4S binding protein [Anaerolineales bacterium]MBL0348383.1 4Fe-4S binding protein [Anaerolineales bacterium]